MPHSRPVSLPLVRKSAIAGALIMLFSAALVAPIHYQLEQRDITSSAEDYNESLANIFSFLVRDRVQAYLLLADRSRNPALAGSIEATLDSAFAQFGEDSRLLKVKLFDDKGILIYSTDESEEGEEGDDADAGFDIAFRDKVVSSDLTFRHDMNTLHGMSMDRHVVSSYIPIFGDAAHRNFIGLFEIYSDVTAREAAFWQGLVLELILLIVIVGMGYAGLMLVIWMGAQDIDRAHQARLAMAEKLAALSAAGEAKTRLLMSMSHHLKTPLNAIIGFSEMIKGERVGPVGDRRYINYASDILASGRDLLRGVDNILDFVRVDSGAVQPNADLLLPQDLMESVVRSFAPAAAAADVSLSVASLSVDPDCMRTDPRYLRQILRILVDNSIRYNRPGGHVWLSMHALPEDKLAFTIADDGIGIDEADIPGVFVPFGSKSQILTQVQDGFGIGLPLAKRIAEFLGGDLGLARRAEGGMLATLTLPRELA